MKIIIHIGTMKTGSTYLQNCLCFNSQILLDHGIAYKTLYTNENNELKIGNAFSVSSLQTYIKYAQTVGAEILLLSCETITNSDIWRHADILAPHDVHLIGYVRYFTAHLERTLLQSMFTTYIDLKKQDTIFSFYKKVKKLCKLSFIKSCSLFSYEKIQKIGLAKHFFSKLNIMNFHINSDMSGHETNVTLPTAYLQFIDMLKYLPTTVEENYMFRDYFQCILPLVDMPRYLLLNPQFYYQWARRHKRDLDRLSQDIGYADYTKDSLSWMEKQPLCPWKELPREQFCAIYDTLPENLQTIIWKYMPQGKDIYTTIQKFRDKRLFPLYLTNANREIHPSDFVPERKVAKIALNYAFDKSLNNPSYFFDKLLLTYPLRCKNLIVSEDRMRFSYRTYRTAYKKMLCLELARLLGNRNMYPLLMCGQRVLPEMLENVKWYTHRKYILDNLQRTKDRPILVYGAGFLFNKYYPYFQHHHIHCILLDGEQLPKAIDGIPVAHPEDVLPASSDMPVFIFIQQAPLIKQRIQRQFPQCIDIVTCCF